MLGVAVWEAPIDLKWNSTREGQFGFGFPVDNSIRSYLGDDDFAGEGGVNRIAEAKSGHADIAHQDGGTDYVNADTVPLWYAACQSVAWSNTIVATLNDGTDFTGGNGDFLQTEAEAVGVPFDHYIASGANHDDVNAYGSEEMADWAEHLFDLVSSGTITATVTVSGSGFSDVPGDVIGSGTIAAAVTTSGAGLADPLGSGTITASITASGAGKADPLGSGTVTAAVTVAGVGFSQGPGDVLTAGTISAAILLGGFPLVDHVAGGTISFSVTVSGSTEIASLTIRRSGKRPDLTHSGKRQAVNA